MAGICARRRWSPTDFSGGLSRTSDTPALGGDRRCVGRCVAHGGKPLPYLRKHGFDGDIYVVNPRYPSIDGVRYASIGSFPEVPGRGPGAA
jgi:hypothetical protein